jgi:hypothetical protein
MNNMTGWKVTIQVPGADGTQQLELEDVMGLFKAYPEVKRNFFDDLVSIVKQNPAFYIGAKITAVTGPDESDWAGNPWLLLIARETELSTPLWLLFKREKTLAGYLVALGPPPAATYAKENGLDELRRILEYVVAFSSRWDISVFLPEIPDELIPTRETAAEPAPAEGDTQEAPPAADNVD